MSLVIVAMGVAGAGKTTIARPLATRLGFGFAEGDDFHPPGNVVKMRGGTPLTDDDRWPWLDAVAAEIGRAIAARRGLVFACSALKRAYRDRIAAGRPEVRFVHLTGEPALIRARIEARRDHYMPPALLASQLATLEPPGADEPCLTIDIREPPETCVDRIIAGLGLAPWAA